MLHLEFHRSWYSQADVEESKEGPALNVAPPVLVLNVSILIISFMGIPVSYHALPTIMWGLQPRHVFLNVFQELSLIMYNYFV